MLVMKKILLPFISFFLFQAVLAQQITDSPASKKISTEEYDQMIKQANSKKTGAFIMVFGGSALAIGGLFVAASGMETQTSYDGNTTTTTVTDDSKVTTGTIMMLAGLGIGVGSIPLFVQSHKLREKAMLGLHGTTIRMPVPNGSMVALPQTQLTLIIPLGR
jgi:hypothetical protein